MKKSLLSGASAFALILAASAVRAQTVVSIDNDAGLRGLSTASYRVVIREGYLNYHDVPPLVFIASSGACSISGGDGGSQVPSSDGNCWLSVPTAHMDVGEFGVSAANSDNGPYMDRAFAWAATRGNPDGTYFPGSGLGGSGGCVADCGAHLTMQAGQFLFQSTFDCHNATSIDLEGQGLATVWYRTGDYGDTFTCSNAHSVRIAKLWADQDIGSGLTNLTTRASAHFHYTNVTHFTFDNVIAANANYNWKIDSSIDGQWIKPQTLGIYDGTHNQTVADISFSGSDGGIGTAVAAASGLGYAIGDTGKVNGGTLVSGASAASYKIVAISPTVKVQFLNQGDYSTLPGSGATTTATSGSGSGLTLNPTASLGHPQIMAIHDPFLGGNPLQAPASKTLTSGSNSRTVSNFTTEAGPLDHILVNSLEGLVIDGGNAINGAAQSSLHLKPSGLPGQPILQMHLNGAWWDGAGIADVYVDNSAISSCSQPNSAASGLNIDGGLMDGELSGFNAVYVPDNLPGCPALLGLHITGVEAVAYVKSPYWLGSVKGGSIVGGTARNYNAYGVFANDVASSSAVWAYGTTSNFHIGEFGAGGGNNYEPLTATPGSPYTAPDQSMYGVSFQGGLVNVTRSNIQNNGYFADYGGAAPSVSCGILTVGSDNRHGRVTTSASSGNVTSCNIAFFSGLSSTSALTCHVTEGQNKFGIPVGSAIAPASLSAGGFAVYFDATSDNGSEPGVGIGNGGSFTYTCDGIN